VGGIPLFLATLARPRSGRTGLRQAACLLEADGEIDSDGQDFLATCVAIGKTPALCSIASDPKLKPTAIRQFGDLTLGLSRADREFGKRLVSVRSVGRRPMGFQQTPQTLVDASVPKAPFFLLEAGRLRTIAEGDLVPDEAHNLCSPQSADVCKTSPIRGNSNPRVFQCPPTCATIRVEMWDLMWDRCYGKAD
jgi:hypothetical protein